MAKDFLIGVGIGLVGGAAFKSAVGGSIRRIDALGREISDLQARAKRVQAIRALKPQIDRAGAAMREARERATRLGRELHTAERPTKRLRREFEVARN